LKRIKDWESTGFYQLPVQRLFAFYITRLLIFKRIDMKKQDPSDSEFSNMNMQESLRKILIDYYVPKDVIKSQS